MVSGKLFLVLLALTGVKGAAVPLHPNAMNDMYSYELDFMATDKPSATTIRNVILTDDPEVVMETFDEEIEEPQEETEDIDNLLLKTIHRFDANYFMRFNHYGSTILTTCVLLMPLLGLAFGMFMLVKERLDNGMTYKVKRGRTVSKFRVGNKYEML